MLRQNHPMREVPVFGARARLRIWLAIGYMLFIVYGSLTPFFGWREQGVNFIEVLGAPFSLTYTAFDATVNFLAYLPFGLLMGLTLRARFRALACVMIGSCSGILLSTSMEFLQMYLPTRTSSNLDILTNSMGTLAGTLLSMGIAAWPGVISRLTGWRHNLFRQGKETDFGLALLALWVFAQINPSLPMLGNVFITGLAPQPFVSQSSVPIDWWQSATVALNLLMLGTLMLTLLRVPRHAATASLVMLSLVALAKFIAAAVLLKSWALLLWVNSASMLGMLLGMLLLLGILWLPRNAILVSGGIIATTYFAIINFEFNGGPSSAATSVYHWHYGHLLNYNGLAQTIFLCFPLLLILHLWRNRKS
jgi:VanZ family protein